MTHVSSPPSRRAMLAACPSVGLTSAGLAFGSLLIIHGLWPLVGTHGKDGSAQKGFCFMVRWRVFLFSLRWRFGFPSKARLVPT